MKRYKALAIRETKLEKFLKYLESFEFGQRSFDEDLETQKLGVSDFEAISREMSGGNDEEEHCCDGAVDTKRDKFEIATVQGDLTMLSQNRLAAEGRGSPTRNDALLDEEEL